ncbi:rab11 family-interacting protein 1 isoform X1 [Erinaceus europaeus]|uniref:Rab11 family-interacting protein 1 isoform X1 n=2 Tax=Erinaceus europaeus TaxID=9365 RepID=A0A1S2ZBC7_ERIEU|nr:rab11 family-interacting protein 1 isoform X1 [Erinaceus europaeus]
MSLAASAGRGPGTLWSPTHVQVTVLQARGLRAKGPGGTSDAYAVIQVGKEKYATSVSERSLGAPVWREEATFELPPLLSAGAAPAAAATLQLTVLHRSLLGLDKFLGRAEVDLRELHRDQGRRKTQWYTLKSKPGKKEKERGEIEVDIQFMRNNMTASMFDLSMKDKSRNPFGKLKDKIKGKNKDSASDTASAIVPSTTPSVDSDDESPSKGKKKKSKIKTLFSKSNLQKTPLSQSMSVLPTSKSDKVLLRPGDFPSRWGDDDDENEDESSSASDVMSHKRTASADPKQLSQMNFTLPRKDGLSFLGGLRSKNDVLSRSNVCINGNHVYMEQPEAKSETKDSSPSSSPSPSPQGFRKKHLFSSTENLAARSWKEPGEGGTISSDKRPSESSTQDSLKSTSLPSHWPPVSSDLRESTAMSNLETVKETKESKKPESKKSSLLSLVTGKKDTSKGGEGESPPSLLGKEKEVKPREDRPVEDVVRRHEQDPTAVVSRQGRSLNPFEEVQTREPEVSPESKLEPALPVASARALQTKAVKPRLEVSPEAQPTARLLSPPDLPLFFSALSSSSGQTPVLSKLGQDPETPSSECPSVFSSFPSPIAAPISTSTPIEAWPSTDKDQASSEEPSLLLKAELQKESLPQAPCTISRALGSFSKDSSTPMCDGVEDSPVKKAGEIKTEKSTGSDSEKPLLDQPEVEQKKELLELPLKKKKYTPSSVEVQEIASSLSVRNGGHMNSSGKHVLGNDTERKSSSFVENSNRSGELAAITEEVTPPLLVREAAPPLDTVTQKHEEAGLNVSEVQKKTKKRVSFSEQLFTEEEVEKLPGLDKEDKSNQEDRGTVTRNVSEEESSECLHTRVSEREVMTKSTPVVGLLPCPSHEESLSEGQESSETSLGKDGPLFSVEGDDARMAQNQSKASDHEGLLSDPLSDLQLASDVISPGMADLDLSLPSIPEVPSDDERIDQVEGDRDAAEVAIPEAELSSPTVCPEKDKESSGKADGLVMPPGSPRECRPEAPETSSMASSEVLGTHKAGLGLGSSLAKQPLGPNYGKEEKLLGSGRPNHLSDLVLDSTGSNLSFSEPFSATHSFPHSPHSDTHHTRTTESQKKATAEGSAGKVESSGKKKPLLQAWVSPSEAHPGSAQPSTGSAKHRLHPVKPMNTTATKIANSSLGTATIISENLINEAIMKKYNPSDPAFAYAQLTHDELIQLVLKQKETISKKEFQVRELEDYIDNLLVRVMEETPNILRVPAQVGKKAGKM